MNEPNACSASNDSKSSEKVTQFGWLTRRYPLGITSRRFCYLDNVNIWQDKIIDITTESLLLNLTYRIISKDSNLENVDTVIQIIPETKIQLENKKNCFKVEDLDGNSAILEAQSLESMMNWILSLRSSCFATSRVCLSMFKSIAVIGRGYYGKVTLVKDKETGKKYAMKSIQKKKLLKAHKVHTIVIERDILMKVRKHPFIVSMKFCFQTASKFYVGMQFVPGGDLFHRMKMCGSKETIPIHDVRLYIAEIALALDFLHENEIIYRDLKPENVLIDAQGHIKLVDFGLSKMFGDKNYSNVESHSETSHDHQKAHSICGTPEYNSPEMVLKIPYDYNIDWWSLGILTYDLIFRRTPFYDKNTSKLFQNILESEPKFRENIPIDESTKSFILMLLKKNQSERPSFEQIKSHEFFQGLDFNNVYNKQIQPIYIPNIKKIELNFDREFIEEKAFDSYAPPESDSNVNISDFSCSWLTVSDSETMEKQEY